MATEHNREVFSQCHITGDRKKNAATPAIPKVCGDCAKSSKESDSCNSLGGYPPYPTKKMEGVKGSDHDYVLKTFNSSSLTLLTRITPSTGSHFNKSWSGSGQVEGGDV